MDKFETEHQANVIDFMTNAMITTHFLYHISDVIFDPKRNNVSVREFYRQWAELGEFSKPKVPLNPGALMGYLYCGIVLPYEHWKDLLPAENLARLDPSWGLQAVEWKAPEEGSMTLPRYVKRVRNAVAHGRVVWNVGQAEGNDVLRSTKIKFYDVQRAKPEDTFETELSFDSISGFIKKFQSVIHPHVRAQVERKQGTASAQD